MKRSVWLSSLIAATVLTLSACGTVVDTSDVAGDSQLVAADSTVSSGDAALLTPEYWKENGPEAPYDVCFVMADEASESDFELVYTPPGYVWKLVVVTQLGDPNDTHFLFENPVEGDVFETGGYDQVIGCKNTEPEFEDGCAFTQGYWKTHSAYGPAPYDATWSLVEPDAEDSAFYLSGLSYYEVMHTPPRGNAYFILAHQYIAAVLNQLSGADTSDIDGELAEAQAFFEAYAPSDSLSREASSDAKDLAETLDDYNNGRIGPGHCG